MNIGRERETIYIEPVEAPAPTPVPPDDPPEKEPAEVG